MMGHQPEFQSKLFYHGFNLEQRVPQNHILRKVKKRIDFDFIYDEVKDSYGINGNVSVPPPVILKMMLLLIFYNVRSERELIDTIPLRIDWLWFLGYDVDDEIPNHSQSRRSGIVVISSRSDLTLYRTRRSIILRITGGGTETLPLYP